MTTAFDYVEYDQESEATQILFKRRFVDLHKDIETYLKQGRARSLVLTKLEEAYMWVGKSIRDEQILRNPHTELQEQRNNG